MFGNQKVFLDLRDELQTEHLESAIRKLGGTVEKFLSRDITYVITNRDKLDKDSQSSSYALTSQNVASLSNSTISRGQKLLMRSNSFQSSKPNTVSSTDAVQFALLWNIPVITVDIALKNIHSHQYSMKILSSVKNNSENRTPVTSRLSLAGSYLKFEDAKRRYRPVYANLLAFGTISFDQPSGNSIFEYPNVSKKCQQRKRDVQACDKESVKNVSKNKVPVGNKGYCECCDQYYIDLHKHLQGQTHRSFGENSSNYAGLDVLLSELPSVYSLQGSTDLTVTDNKLTEELNNDVALFADNGRKQQSSEMSHCCQTESKLLSTENDNKVILTVDKNQDEVTGTSCKMTENSLVNLVSFGTDGQFTDCCISKQDISTDMDTILSVNDKGATTGNNGDNHVMVDCIAVEQINSASAAQNAVNKSESPSETVLCSVTDCITDTQALDEHEHLTDTQHFVRHDKQTVADDLVTVVFLSPPVSVSAPQENLYSTSYDNCAVTSLQVLSPVSNASQHSDCSAVGFAETVDSILARLSNEESDRDAAANNSMSSESILPFEAEDIVIEQEHNPVVSIEQNSTICSEANLASAHSNDISFMGMLNRTLISENDTLPNFSESSKESARRDDFAYSDISSAGDNEMETVALNCNFIIPLQHAAHSSSAIGQELQEDINGKLISNVVVASNGAMPHETYHILASASASAAQENINSGLSKVISHPEVSSNSSAGQDSHFNFATMTNAVDGIILTMPQGHLNIQRQTSHHDVDNCDNNSDIISSESTEPLEMPIDSEETTHFHAAALLVNDLQSLPAKSSCGLLMNSLQNIEAVSDDSNTESYQESSPMCDFRVNDNKDGVITDELKSCFSESFENIASTILHNSVGLCSVDQDYVTNTDINLHANKRLAACDGLVTSQVPIKLLQPTEDSCCKMSFRANTVTATDMVMEIDHSCTSELTTDIHDINENKPMMSESNCKRTFDDQSNNLLVLAPVCTNTLSVNGSSPSRAEFANHHNWSLKPGLIFTPSPCSLTRHFVEPVVTCSSNTEDVFVNLSPAHLTSDIVSNTHSSPSVNNNSVTVPVYRYHKSTNKVAASEVCGNTSNIEQELEILETLASRLIADNRPSLENNSDLLLDLHDTLLSIADVSTNHSVDGGIADVPNIDNVLLGDFDSADLNLIEDDDLTNLLLNYDIAVTKSDGSNLPGDHGLSRSNKSNGFRKTPEENPKATCTSSGAISSSYLSTVQGISASRTLLADENLPNQHGTTDSGSCAVSPLPSFTTSNSTNVFLQHSSSRSAPGIWKVKSIVDLRIRLTRVSELSTSSVDDRTDVGREVDQGWHVELTGS